MLHFDANKDYYRKLLDLRVREWMQKESGLKSVGSK